MISPGTKTQKPVLLLRSIPLAIAWTLLNGFLVLRRLLLYLFLPLRQRP